MNVRMHMNIYIYILIYTYTYEYTYTDIRIGVYTYINTKIYKTLYRRADRAYYVTPNGHIKIRCTLFSLIFAAPQNYNPNVGET